MRWCTSQSAGCLAALAVSTSLLAQPGGRGGAQQFPGGTNPDGSLKPSAPLTRLFTQDAYTEYALLEPGSESFRIRFLPEETRVGATELVNATRGGSEGGDIEVYDPRTGKPLPFTYEQQGNDPTAHAIRAKLPQPVPQGGIGRVVIYKTYKDPRTYMMNGEDLVWVRSLSGYRLGVLLPKGFAFISSNVAAQMSTTSDGRLKLAFANPSGQANPVTIHARRTTASFPAQPFNDVFFDDIKTLYDLDQPQTSRISIDQTYSDYRKGAVARLDTLQYLPITRPKAVDLDTGKELAVAPSGAGGTVKLEVPITDERQSVHLRLTGTMTADRGYRLINGELVFDLVLKGLRNTVILPAGWELAHSSQSGTIGTYQGRTFIAYLNLNAENEFRVVITAQRAK